MLAVSSTLDTDLAYELTKQIYENHERVVVAHSVGKYIVAETATDGMSVELHEGAAKYFKEVGVIE